jgi:predicted GNAT family acetyltransferase/glutaredoxin
VLTLYQAEWCPFSSAVREILTELGLDFVARQVEPWPEQRSAMREALGTDQIPTLVTEDGRVFSGTRAIYAYLREIEPWEHADAHRRRFLDHHAARESDAPGQLVEYFHPSEEAAEVTAQPAEAVVVDVPESSRYELRVGDRAVGIAAYHRRGNRIAFTHTEVDESCEGHGFGSRLAQAALDDVRRQGLEVVPLCPFVAGYVARHPEYEELVPPDYRRAA